MSMPGAAKARAPNLPTKDSKVVKWTHWAHKTEHNSSNIRPPFADGTKKVAPRKSADRPSHTKSVLGISTDFDSRVHKVAKGNFQANNDKGCRACRGERPWLPRAGVWHGRDIADPNASIVEQEQVPQAQTPKETGHLSREARVDVRRRLPTKVEDCVHIVYTIPFEAEELLATLCQADMKVTAYVIDIVSVLPFICPLGRAACTILQIRTDCLCTTSSGSDRRSAYAALRVQPPQARPDEGVPRYPHRPTGGPRLFSAPAGFRPRPKNSKY
jgi:hypothetical protein